MYPPRVTEADTIVTRLSIDYNDRLAEVNALSGHLSEGGSVLEIAEQLQRLWHEHGDTDAYAWLVEMAESVVALGEVASALGTNLDKMANTTQIARENRRKWEAAHMTPVKLPQHTDNSAAEGV